MTENTGEQSAPSSLPCYQVLPMRCFLRVLISGSDTAAWRTREIELPFVPFVGLRITGLTNPRGNVEHCTAAVVTWDVEEGRFDVELEMDDLAGTTLADMLDDYGAEWTLWT